MEQYQTHLVDSSPGLDDDFRKAEAASPGSGVGRTTRRLHLHAQEVYPYPGPTHNFLSHGKLGVGREMATPQELKAVLKETLENRGALGKLRAQIRAEVFKALDDKAAVKPKLTQENFLINELIREYLEFNEYNYTSSVLLAETGQPKEPLERDFLASELGIVQDGASGTVPLLYAILSHFMKRSNSQEHGSTAGMEETHNGLQSHHQVEVGETLHVAPPEPLVVRGTAAKQN